MTSTILLYCLSGYVVQGSNGEYAYLTDQERVDMVQYVCKIVPKDKLIIAGSGCECEYGNRELEPTMCLGSFDQLNCSGTYAYL